MAINLNDNIFSSSPKLLDAKWGPFPDTDSAYTAVGKSFRKIGMFAIISPPAGPAQLYWYKNDTDTLVPFSGNSSVQVYATYNDFPGTGLVDVIYIDKSNSLSYYWNTSLNPADYTLSGTTVEVYPSKTGSSPGTDSFPNTGVENVIYVASDTDISYIWNPTLLAGNGDYEILIGTAVKERVTYHECNSGTVNVYVASNATVTTNTIGDAYLVKFDIANTGPSTLQIGTGPVASLYNTKTGTTLQSGDLESGVVHLVVYTSKSPSIFEVLTIGGGGTADTGNIRFNGSQIYSIDDYVDIHSNDNYVQFSYTNTYYTNSPLEINQNWFSLDNNGANIEVSGNDVDGNPYLYGWYFSSSTGILQVPGRISFGGLDWQSIGKGNVNAHGGAYGISLFCTVGYELNWQAGYLSARENTAPYDLRPIYSDSLIKYPTQVDDPAYTIFHATFDDDTLISKKYLEDKDYSGILTADITNWNTAYGWGDHASAGYMLQSTYDVDTDGVVDATERTMFQAKNGYGTTLTKGTIVYLKTSSSDANYPEVLKANANSEATSSKTIGAVYEDIAAGAIGYIITNGRIHNLNTNAYNVGDKLWLATTDGGVTTTPPTQPDHTVFIGTVTRKQTNNGGILYSIQNGFELNELHNVLITTPATGHYLYYDATTDPSNPLWKNSFSWQGDTIAVTKGGTGLTSYALGDILYATDIDNISTLPIGAIGEVLLANDETFAPSWGKVGLTTHISGTLPVVNGGTNITSYTTGDILYANTTNSLAKLAGVAVGSVLVSGGVGTAPSWSNSPELRSIILDNASNANTITLNTGITSTSYTITLPTAEATGAQYLQTIGAGGTLQWASGTTTGISSLSAIGSSANANGATITGSVLNLQPANASFGGVVTTGTQTLAGAKTLSSALTISPTSNQLVLGTTNTTTISATNAGGAKTYTIPNVGTTSNFLMSTGTQSFSSIFSLTQADSTVASYINLAGIDPTGNVTHVNTVTTNTVYPSGMKILFRTYGTGYATYIGRSSNINSMLFACNTGGRFEFWTAYDESIRLSSNTILINNGSGTLQQVIGARITGWGATSGTISRAALTLTAAATYSQTDFNTVIQALKAVITDLRTHGLINN